MPDLKANYLELKDASATVQDIYKYDPVKAKQMLADAGYPDGFSATIYTQNNEANVDYLAVIKDMWAKIDVNNRYQTAGNRCLQQPVVFT